MHYCIRLEKFIRTGTGALPSLIVKNHNRVPTYRYFFQTFYPKLKWKRKSTVRYQYVKYSGPLSNYERDEGGASAPTTLPNLSRPYIMAKLL